MARKCSANVCDLPCPLKGIFNAQSSKTMVVAEHLEAFVIEVRDHNLEAFVLLAYSI